jgi:hypothetical protein
MYKLENVSAVLADTDIEQAAGGAQEDYFTYQQSALTYQRAANSGQAVGFEYGGLKSDRSK